MCFFAYESEKREAEAFAMSTAALILGGLAIVGGGAAILSRTGAGTLGEKVVSGFEAAGGKIADLLNYNSVTDKGTLVMNMGLKVAMNNAIGQLKSEASSSKAEYSNSSSITSTSSGNIKMASNITASEGDVLEVSFDYSDPSPDYYGDVYAAYISGVSPKALSSAATIKLRNSSSGHYSKTIVVDISITDKTVYAAGSGDSLTISNLTVRNLTKMDSPGYQQYKQYQSMSSNADDRMAQINTALNKSQYVVSANSVQENVSTIQQLESTLASVEENTAGTNTLIDRMITALGNIPSAIKSEMSNLWADAGAIWTGMNDTLINIKTDVGAKIGAMSDTMAGGIDNIRTDIGAMMENLRSGIDAVGTNVAGWGQLTLEGIEAGVSSISTALTDTWTKITTKITEGVGTITDGIGKLTDGLTGVIEWIIGFPAMLFGVFVPPDFAFVDPLMNELQVDFDSKFSQFDALDQIFQNMFGATKSIYDIQVTFFGRQYYIVPILYKPTIDSFRPFMTGLLDLYVVTLLYRRYKGDTVIPL